MQAKVLLTALALLAGGAFAAEPKVLTVAQFAALDESAVAATGPVVVNGVVTYSDGQLTGRRAGRFLDRANC